MFYDTSVLGLPILNSYNSTEEDLSFHHQSYYSFSTAGTTTSLSGTNKEVYQRWTPSLSNHLKKSLASRCHPAKTSRSGNIQRISKGPTSKWNKIISRQLQPLHGSNACRLLLIHNYFTEVNLCLCVCVCVSAHESKSATVYSFQENRLQHFLCLLSFQRNVKSLLYDSLFCDGRLTKGAEERGCCAE